MLHIQLLKQLLALLVAVEAHGLVAAQARCHDFMKPLGVQACTQLWLTDLTPGRLGCVGTTQCACCCRHQRDKKCTLYTRTRTGTHLLLCVKHFTQQQMGPLLLTWFRSAWALGKKQNLKHKEKKVMWLKRQ
jgi:hypothetical protein